MSPSSKHRQGTGEKGNDTGHGKEWKTCSRHSFVGAGMPASAYNPGTGMFHVLESSVSESGVISQSGRFRSIEDSDEIGSVVGSYSEYDSMSNNGSCSGESEDQLQHGNAKDKKGHPPGVVGGASDKGEKIRYKNEKKHQRQKERRAQELRDRCMGYLMSRKLEALAQQLVAMGFSSDRATMALILNDGHVERSVSWLLEGGCGYVKEDWTAEGSLKLDISEELARIADLEIRFKYLRVEIQRAIVACEGDLDKAAVWLRDRHRRIPPTAPEYRNNLQDSVREPLLSAGTAMASPYLMSVQGTGSGLSQALSHQRRQEKESHTAQNRSEGYQSIPSRAAGCEGNLGRRAPLAPTELPRLFTGVEYSPQGYQSVLSLRPGSSEVNLARSARLFSATDVVVGKPIGMKTSAKPVPLLQPSPRRPASDSRPSSLDNGLFSQRERTVLLSTRDPIVTPHLSRSPITPPSNGRSASVSPSLSPTSWNGNTPSGSSPSSVLFFNGTPGDKLFKSVAGGKSTADLSSKDAEKAKAGQPLQPNGLGVPGQGWGNSESAFGSRDNVLPAVVASGSHRRSQSTPKFLSGWGSGLPGGPADWSMWVSSGCDYQTIDWSTGASPTTSSETTAWGGFSHSGSILNLGGGAKPREGVTREETLQGQPVDSEQPSGSVNYHLWSSSNREKSETFGLQEKSSDPGSLSGVGVPEWTSPFAGKDLFTLPHHAVPSTLL